MVNILKILVIGGNRYVGKEVAQNLSHFHDVTVLNRRGIGPPKCKIIQLDRKDYNEYYKYDIIIDFCLYNEEQAQHLIQHTFPNQKYIFISSSAVYYDNNCASYNEEMKIGGLKAFDKYGINKSKAEAVIQSSTLNYVILRPPYIIGGDEPHPRINYYNDAILNNTKISFGGDGEDVLLSFIWHEDLVNFITKDILSNFEKYSKNTYNITSDEYYTERGLFWEIFDITQTHNKSINYDVNNFESYSQNSIFTNCNLILSPLKLGKKFYIKKHLEHKLKFK